MARPITLGMVNVLHRNQPMQERRERLLHWVEEAGRRGCQIVALPEFADHHVTHEAGEAHRQSIDELRRVVGLTWDAPFIKSLRESARKHGMVVIPDVLWLEGGRPYNRCVVIGPEGERLGHYDKVHLAPEEQKTVDFGAKLEPVATPFGKLGLLVCYDINFPEITRCYELQGAEILIWTTMRQCESEEILYRAVLPARAYEHKLPFAVTTYVTPNQHLNMKPMTSAVFNALGQLVAGSMTCEGVVAGTVDLDARPLLRRAWANPQFVDASRYFARQRHPELYGPLTRRLGADEANPALEPTVAEYPDFAAPKI
ncbi:MAG: carbon-nitrogen hydrolase family protein [Planctomycetota bacterium]|nr:carbon-nitrogen hydrolase family protein [Planctomycetota bacterium]